MYRDNWFRSFFNPVSSPEPILKKEEKMKKINQKNHNYPCFDRSYPYKEYAYSLKEIEDDFKRLFVIKDINKKTAMKKKPKANQNKSFGWKVHPAFMVHKYTDINGVTYYGFMETISKRNKSLIDLHQKEFYRLTGVKISPAQMAYKIWKTKFDNQTKSHK